MSDNLETAATLLLNDYGLRPPSDTLASIDALRGQAMPRMLSLSSLADDRADEYFAPGQ